MRLTRTALERQRCITRISTIPLLLKASSMAASTENGEISTENGLRKQLSAEEPPLKRVKLAEAPSVLEDLDSKVRTRVKGIAMIKSEYRLKSSNFDKVSISSDAAEKDDAAEAGVKVDDRDNPKKKSKAKGQNSARHFGSSKDMIPLCNSRATSSEFSPKECSFGDRCNMCHDIRKYLKEGKRADLTTLGGKCPVWEANGRCYVGWKCRFVSSHSTEVTREDGRKELVLIEDEAKSTKVSSNDDDREGIYNVVSTQAKIDLGKRKTKTPKSDQYSAWLDKDGKAMEKHHNTRKDATEEEREDNRAQFTDPPFKASEKRRIYFGPETPILAPLTTQGNLPFRRLCVELGAQLTFSEMALAMPLVQGQKAEWALMKAHESEMTPPRFGPSDAPNSSIVQNYDNSRDLKFGVQISAPKPYQALKAAEVLTALCPHMRVLDLNCGCPIDLVYQSGAGSALLDAPTKLEKMVRGMSAVSGEVPVTAKIRMGTRDAAPSALKNIERLAFGSQETRDRLGAPGCAAVTLHGRSRQQRYTRSANWGYVAECAALVRAFGERRDRLADTVREPDESTMPNAAGGAAKMYFIGNGDVYSHVDYDAHIRDAGVDGVMVARGALVKPWLFEEIALGQYIDKSATERLAYIERFVRYGLETWGADEMGVGTTRRFLLEWLSFAYRYVPVGVLEHLPPSLQDRPEAWKGRTDLEGLMASHNYLDWVKIRYVLRSDSTMKVDMQKTISQISTCLGAIEYFKEASHILTISCMSPTEGLTSASMRKSLSNRNTVPVQEA